MSSQQVTQLTSWMKEIDTEHLQKGVQSTFGDVTMPVSTRPIRVIKRLKYENKRIIVTDSGVYVQLSKEESDHYQKEYNSYKLRQSG
jgi:hypothetical protein